MERLKEQVVNNRLAIFCFYDPDGIVDRYVEYYLYELFKVVRKIIIVVNGILTPNGRDKLSSFSDNIIVRENKGLDIWAYKEGLEWVGWEQLCEYDEVVLSNDTLMGPVYPFREMFDEMGKRKELDFWGITRFLNMDINPFGNPYGYIPEHVQSSFTVYRKKFLKTRELQEYWKNLPLFNSYEEAIGKHESYFTKYFGDMGFHWDTYVNNSAEEKFNSYLLLAAPKKALSEYKCPVFKRKSFFKEHSVNLNDTIGESASELLHYLKESTSYDTSMIFENIIRRYNMSDIIYNLGLFYVLPEGTQVGHVPDSSRQNECALIMHNFYLDLLEEAVHYASSMPQGSDIYITTPFKDHQTEIERAFSVLNNKVTVRIIENRGRDVSALLVGCADVIRNYKYICFWHDKKSGQVKPGSVGCSWGYKLSNCVLATETYVHNVIHLFDENPFLGLLMPMPPNHGEYFHIGGGEWSSNYENTKALAEKLGIRVPISREVPPAAPIGTVFWFRGEALRPLAEYGWSFADFPKEPNAADKTILHAIERIYGYAAQQAGYLSAYLTTDKIVSYELAAHLWCWRGYGKICEEAHTWGSESTVRWVVRWRLNYTSTLEQQVQDLKQEINNLIPQTSLKTQLRLRLKRWLPRWLYGTVVRIKRFFFGPHGVGYSFDENQWESGIAR